ncbi:hypothetical protein [Pasteuria penetrans]|nr:hypothetical protein [Pasteuria penetrans]
MVLTGSNISVTHITDWVKEKIMGLISGMFEQQPQQQSQQQSQQPQ